MANIGEITVRTRLDFGPAIAQAEELLAFLQKQQKLSDQVGSSNHHTLELGVGLTSDVPPVKSESQREDRLPPAK